MASSSSSEAIALALKEHVYDECLIDKLEPYVTEQVNASTYDFIANKALLKLYSFFPQRRNEQITAQILIKAIMNLPSTDMTLCLYLVPEDVRESESIRQLVKYWELLEAAKFVEFWEAANLGGNTLLDSVPGFDTAIRSYMVGVLAISYQRIESDVFMELLALDKAHLDAYVNQMPNLMNLDENKTSVVFTANAQNQPRPMTFKENISFDRMVPVMSLLTV
mmetsp:Transcript_1714/g.2243  ORF Transcript_1714/g.2243 Transcript_1714/m.2243 type:complete len:222 (-) Transcript_1714:223-888(-)|eukprot:CAMPEP_0114387742 /NCGR_PEP_ID=MMETSP0102-20121206/7469_1 /TAXON_ID=38822 ORGANISM="Pteridomonas danica, Strain PT" /NCGR_SAMPLE_ID=MMETSP0102 /ASSEMBLY_ACC=CAM_ASM_000212 /LENGTH=221 /DNA_ID=CAMNT_0001544959 /DNA_START=5 /DNA_END=670 /DNA_ORIENTATION=+